MRRARSGGPFVVQDLDGVLTSTAALHAACWKQTFEAVLGEPFDADRDGAHVVVDDLAEMASEAVTSPKGGAE